MEMGFKNTEVFNFSGAFRGMRNPMNSWELSDSYYDNYNYTHDDRCFKIGEKDLKLAQKLIKAGGEHRKFLRMIHVCTDVTLPRYLWSELDTYHFGTKNSCSTMHKLLNTKEPITSDLFLFCEEDLPLLSIMIAELEKLRFQYHNDKLVQEEKDKLLLRAKRLLPEGYLQMRTWDTNYEEIRNIYYQRKNHRLKEEWQDCFCKWVESLPHAKELILFN